LGFQHSKHLLCFCEWLSRFQAFAGASLRTNAVVVLALAILVLTFFFLGAGNYGAHITLIHWGGYFGVAAAACAFYLALAELCEASYGRTVLPVWPLTKR